MLTIAGRILLGVFAVIVILAILVWTWGRIRAKP